MFYQNKKDNMKLGERDSENIYYHRKKPERMCAKITAVSIRRWKRKLLKFSP